MHQNVPGDGKRGHHSIIIIGAGITGLHAAQLLKKQYPDVLVVEAQDRIGGRIKQVEGLAPWPIEAGPEFIHGNKSTFTEVVKDYGFNYTEKAWPDWWYFAKDKKLLRDEEVDSEVDKVHELFESIGDAPKPPPGSDISVEQFMRQRGATERQLSVADACYANDFSCSLAQLGLRESITENQRWDSGETYLLADQSMSLVIDRLARGVPILTSWPVSRVAYSSTGAVLTGPQGRSLSCSRLVVTVSLAVLQRGLISFSPALPEPKQAALGRIKMGNAVKLICSFSRRFWPHDMYDVVCPGCPVPELWMTRYRPTHPHLRTHAITGFVCGARADALSGQPAAEALAAFMCQLDEMFGSETDRTPASSSLVGARVVDWSKEPYVLGAYTYPTLGAEDGDRDMLAAPVDGVLFFAGEATHAAVNPCMQAALETAQRAAQEVAASLGEPARARL